MARSFYGLQHFAAEPTNISLLPFRFSRLHGQELLVNEAGEFLFAPEGTVRALVEGKIDVQSTLYKDLKAKQFVYDNTTSPLLDVLAAKIRTKYDHLIGGTKLHIFVVTLRCEHSCHYCQVSRQTATKGEFDMSQQTADRSISLMLDTPSPHVTLELQGGEPLLAFDIIQYIIPRAKEQAKARGKSIDIVVTTNLACATNEMLMYFKDEGVKISTSLDGPAFLHNRNRPRPGNDSYERAIDGIERGARNLGARKCRRTNDDDGSFLESRH